MEAFVTPIILSYVQKYVNLRRQDAQLSLWEGDAVFQNLDLRLDALQNEFQLPFEFLSGHIHELIIHIPWTKITSEPISITINTIEFVLKLKHLSYPQAPKLERSKSSLSQDDSNKGYITNLVDKIVKNISINCNNIILKYIEEDIVVSMNIQLLSLCSANRQWEPCFIDVNPVNGILRKLIKISDLTICLDKRNSAGQIDVCQEPILYKCSLEARVLVHYLSDQYISTLMNIEVFTRSLDLNISSQQFPMVMRLVLLAMSLKSGELNKQLDATQMGQQDSSEILSANSMLSWAWSKVPSIFPEEELEESTEKTAGGLVNFGIYISNLSVTLKSLEMIPDSIVQNSKKVRYIPIVKLHLIGNYFESCSRGYQWFNAKGGVSQIFVEPLGSFSKRYYSQNMIVFTNDNVSTEYLAGSLFDAEHANNTANTASLKFNFDEHFDVVNESYLRLRSPAASFDMLHFIDIPDSHAFDPELNQNLEYSNLSETTIMRFYINSLTIKHNLAMRGIIDVVQDMINSYDYLPYIAEKQADEPSKLPPPLMDDFDALMNNIPRKTVNIKLNDIQLQLHPLTWTDDNKITKILSNKKMCIENVIPFIVLRVTDISLKIVSPIYENRLVHTTCQLPAKPKELLDASYTTFNMEALETSLVLNWNAIENNVAKIDNIKVNCGVILKKVCWDDDIQQVYGSCTIENFHVTFSRPQQLILYKLTKTVMKFLDKELFELVMSNAKQSYDKSLGVLELHIYKINGQFLQFRNIIGFGGSIESLNVHFIPKEGEIDDTGMDTMLIFDAPKNKFDSGSFLKFKLQFPEKGAAPSHPLLVYLVAKESTFICHPILESILYHEDQIETSLFNPDSKRVEVEHKISRVSVVPERQSRKTNHPDETIHLSSDKGEKCEAITVQSVKAQSDTYFSYIRMEDLSECIIHLETDQCEIIFPENIKFSYNQCTQSGTTNEKIERYIVLRLPAIKFKSSNTLSENIKTELPVKFEDDKPIKTNFSWIIELSELSAYLEGEANPIYILLPVKTSVTLAIDRKNTQEDASLRFNLHLDTAPIACNIYESQILFLRKSVNRLHSVKNIFVCDTILPDSSKLSRISSLDEDLDIKEFLGINSSSELSADVVSSILTQEAQDLNENSSFSLWMQWTLTKVTVNFHVERLSSTTKLVLDMEDFMTSIDKQNCYFKLKNKIGAISVDYYNLRENYEWILCDDLKMAAQPQINENEQLNAFLDLTVTIAEVKNVFKKWGTRPKSEASNTLSEIVLNLKALEFHISLKGINDIMPLVQLIINENDKIPLKNENCSGAHTQSVADLPLVHFNCKGIVLYIPEKEATKNCDVFIFQVDSIDIRPNAENPLTRIPLRPDIYTKAEQLRILSTPGSKVEDRQYELVFNISAATSTWAEILSIKRQNQIGFISNPAVIWNNLEKEPAIKIESLFKGLKISVIYAPCMLYKAIIICGQCLELNCITDLNIDVTINQLLLISNIIKIVLGSFRVSNLQSSSNIQMSLNTGNLYPRDVMLTGTCAIDCNPNAGMNESKYQITPFTDYSSLIRINKSKKDDKSTLKMQNLADNINTDSGFVSIEKTSQRKSVSECQTVPYEISIIAGVFIINLHGEKCQDNSDGSSVIKGSETLLYVKITQPSMLITKKMYEYNIKYSLFDLLVQLSKNECDSFNGLDIIFATEKGNVNSAGIAPPLFSATYKDTMRRKVHINCNVSRPIKMHVCERVIKKILDIQAMINPILAALSENQSNEKLRPIVRGTPIQILRSSIFDADTLNVSLDRFQFDCINQFQCGLKINVVKSNLSIENNYYPESLSVKHITESIFIQSSTRTFLHPMTLKCDLLLKQEHWHRSPAIVIRIETNLLHVDISPQQLLNFFTLKDNLINVWQDYCSKSQIRKEDNTKLPVEIDLRIKESKTRIDIPLPAPKRIKDNSRKEEYFQDDLRAGAFQIKEENENNVEAQLPLPYQMKISSNNKTICWRYPQPRFITNVILYPVLIESQIMESIMCSLEYYNDVLDTFMHFIEFSLSEKETQCPKLPEINTPAFIWRIVIQTKPENLCIPSMGAISKNTENDAHEDADYLSIKDFLNVTTPKEMSIVNPKELISCLRIDSLFQPEKTSLIQAVLRVPHFQINFRNELNTETFKCPQPLKHYTIAYDLCKSQTFASIIISKVNIFALKTIQGKIYTHFDLNFSSKLLDSSSLNMLDVLEPITAKGAVLIENEINCDVIIKSVRLNIGPDMLHTVLTSKQLWFQLLNGEHTSVPIMARLVMCNNTNVPFHFGQSNTTERILLKSNECSFYAFRSDNNRKQLAFTFSNVRDRKCLLDTDNIGTLYLQMERSIIVARLQKLSSTQVCIFIKGQLEICSMSKERFDVQHTIGDQKKHLFINPYGRGSFITEHNLADQCFIRLKLATEGRTWSGEIPLKSKNIPWLVKVPSSTGQQYRSFWVRVIEEDIINAVTVTYPAKRWLVLIWPMFLVRSLLPFKTKMTDVKTGTSYTLEGKGAVEELIISGDNFSEHELTFDGLLYFPQNNSNILLTYKGIQWNTFFELENKNVKIDKCLESLAKIEEPKWSLDAFKSSPTLNEFWEGENVQCVYQFRPSQKYSSSMMLEVIPYCLFLNSTGRKTKISWNLNSGGIVTESNHVSPLLSSNESIKLEIDYGSYWSEIDPIYMKEESFRSNFSKKNILVPEKGHVDLYICNPSSVSKFVLNSYEENSIRMLKLISAFVVLNYTDITFDVVPFTFEDNDKISEKEVHEAAERIRLKIPSSIGHTEHEGIPIDEFYDISARSHQKSALLKHYICLVGKRNNDITLPLLISKPFNRKCFSFLSDQISIALAASVVETDGVFVISVYNDKTPKFQIENHTDLTFFIAGTKTSDGEKSSKIMTDLNERSFEWFQKCYPNANVFYTPLESYRNFPDSENISINLSLALCLNSNTYEKNAKRVVRWSKPLRTEFSRETLLNIPFHGDVKILICNNHKTTKVSIFYITQGMEFSVKELRTRLSDSGKEVNAKQELLEKMQRKIKPGGKQCSLETFCTTCSKLKQKHRLPNVNILFGEICVNIIFESKRRCSKDCILAMYLDNMVMSFSNKVHLLSLTIFNLQLDNQLYVSGKYDFPVIVCAEKEYLKRPSLPSILSLHDYIDELRADALIELKVSFYKEVMDMQTVSCRINPLRAYIEDTYVNDLLDNLIDCDPSNVVYNYEKPQVYHVIKPGYVSVPDSIIEESLYLSGALRLKSFRVEPISLMLSVHTCVRFYIALDHSPLYFSAYEKYDILTLPLKLGHSVGMHYLSGAIFGAGWVVGSLEILGSPGGLARSVSTGLKDFVSLPVRGLLRGPWGFLTGVTQGSASLLKNITAGTVNSVTKLAASVARNLDRLTLDDEHFHRTEALRRSRPQGVTEGITQGLTGLGISLLGALGGLARHPLEARTSVQVVTGVAKGIVGAFAKPLSGAVELLALTGQGMLHTVGFNAMPVQRNENVCKDLNVSPGDCKFAWESIPNSSLLSIDQLLFFHEATLSCVDQLKRVVIALTPVAFMILECSNDWLVDVFLIDDIDVSVDSIDKTIVEVGVLKAVDYTQEADSEFFKSRMLSFLRDSSENLPKVSINSIGEVMVNNIPPGRRYEIKRTIYIEEHLALHLVNYVNVLKTTRVFTVLPVNIEH